MLCRTQQEKEDQMELRDTLKKTHKHECIRNSKGAQKKEYFLNNLDPSSRDQVYTRLIDSSTRILREIEQKQRETFMLKEFLSKKGAGEIDFDQTHLQLEISKLQVKKNTLEQKLDQLQKELRYVR